METIGGSISNDSVEVSVKTMCSWRGSSGWRGGVMFEVEHFERGKVS